MSKIVSKKVPTVIAPKEIVTENIVQENETTDVNGMDIEQLKQQVQVSQNQIEELKSFILKNMNNAQNPIRTDSMDRWCTIIHLEERAPGLYTIFHSSLMEYRFSFFGETRKVRRSELDDILSKNRKYFERLTMTLGAEDSDLIEEYGLPKPDSVTLKAHQLANIVELPLEKLQQIYIKVCDTHKRLIVRKWVIGYYENKNGGYRDINKMNLLNDLSGGALSHILDDMNEQRRMRRS
jgi:hypothetical protein